MFYQRKLFYAMLCKQSAAAEKRSLFLYCTFAFLLMKNVTNGLEQCQTFPKSQYLTEFGCPWLFVKPVYQWIQIFLQYQ
ncbi:unnamed protein product [Larinioides sclopetarius]|uniref:Uncharacterized protein n=1 Tax=Larinioides sclopetarius TaxID=280406 RepID=A0AAV2BV34_9ARAC